jgi:hypothetical protein
MTAVVSGLLQHAVVWGLWLSAWLSAAFIALAAIEPEMWLNDYPPDIRAKHGPQSPSARRLAWLLGTPVLAVALGIVALATRDLLGTGVFGFASIFLHTFVVLTVFNLVDLVLIDWLLFVKIQPRFVILPGTEGSAGYDDYAFHAKAFIKGSLGIVVLSALVAGVVTWTGG